MASRLANGGLWQITMSLKSQILQCQGFLRGKPNRHRVPNAASHRKDFMHMGAVARKGQEKFSTRLDREPLSVEHDLTTVKCLVQVIDRGCIALRRVIGHPIAFFVLPAIVCMSTMVPSRPH